MFQKKNDVTSLVRLSLSLLPVRVVSQRQGVQRDREQASALEQAEFHCFSRALVRGQAARDGVGSVYKLLWTGDTGQGADGKISPNTGDTGQGADGHTGQGADGRSARWLIFASAASTASDGHEQWTSAAAYHHRRADGAALRPSLSQGPSDAARV